MSMNYRPLTEDEQEVLEEIADGLEYDDRIDRIIKKMPTYRRVWASMLIAKLAKGMVPDD